MTIESKLSYSPLPNGSIFELDESLSHFDGVDLFPEKSARAKEIMQKAKISNRLISDI